MGAWIPVKDGIHCRRHQQTFRRGHQCALCFNDPPPTEEAEQERAPFDVEAAAKLPSTLDHERDFIESAEQCDRIANLLVTVILVEIERRQKPKRRKKGESAPEGDDLCMLVNSMSKVRAEATKARRAARESAQAREDWINTRDLEKAAAEIRLGKNRRAASAPVPEVRH